LVIFNIAHVQNARLRKKGASWKLPTVLKFTQMLHMLTTDTVYSLIFILHF